MLRQAALVPLRTGLRDLKPKPLSNAQTALRCGMPAESVNPQKLGSPCDPGVGVQPTRGKSCRAAELLENQIGTTVSGPGMAAARHVLRLGSSRIPQLYRP